MLPVQHCELLVPGASSTSLRAVAVLRACGQSVARYSVAIHENLSGLMSKSYLLSSYQYVFMDCHVLARILPNTQVPERQNSQ